MQLPPLQPFLPQIKKPEFDDQTLKHVVKAMLEASEDAVRKTNDALMALLYPGDNPATCKAV